MKNEVNKQYTAGLGLEANREAPSMFQVLLHNDDFTPKEFVVKMLEVLFYLDRRKAVEVMMEAHTVGKAVCGIFTKDFADAKVMQVEELAKDHEHPLLCSMKSV